MAGLTGNANLISSGVQYAAFIIFTTVTFFFIDRTGRRPLLIYGAIGMGVCHFVVGGVLGSYGDPVDNVEGNGNIKVTVKNNPGAAHTVIAFSYLLIIVYALTLAPVAWVYASEVWSTETRAYGMAIASIANWVRPSLLTRPTHFPSEGSHRQNIFSSILHKSIRSLETNPSYLALQLRPRLLRPPGLPQHLLAHLPNLRRPVLRRRRASLVLVPGDGTQVARGDRAHVQG